MPYVSPENPFEVNEDGSVSLVGDASHTTHKMSGTDMSGIFGCSKWATPFTVACHLLGLGREDISDKPAVKRGIALESKIIAYADKTYGEAYGQFLAAEQVFEKREGDHDSWVSDFEDEMFAGHVDGIVSRDGQDYILEVKTSLTPEDWQNGVPEYYYWQVALYNEFVTKQDKAYVLLGIATENTDRDPASWVATTDTVKMFEMPIDREKVQQRLAEAREWYQGIMESETTPVPSDSDKDQLLLRHLTNIAQSIDQIRKDLDEYEDITGRIDEHEDEISQLLIRQQELKDRIKDYFLANGVSMLQSASGSCTGRLSTRTAYRIAEEKMVLDGIDPQKYKVPSTINTFTVRPVKKSME